MYVAGGVNDVSAYRIDNQSGNASLLIGSPYLAGNSPSSVVVHPSGQFLYVANEADNTISLFNINSTTGALTEVLPRMTSGLSPAFMTMDSGGTLLFVADQISNDVSSFQIGASGALTPVSSVSVGASPAGLVLTTSGFLFVPVPTFSRIAVLSENSGLLQTVGSFPVTDGVAGIAVDSAAKFLYATNPVSNTVSAYKIQSGGSLTAVPGLTFGTGTAPVAAVVDPRGSFLYVADSGSGNIFQFKIDTSTGAVTALTTPTVTVGTNPAFLFRDPGGTFVFVGNTGSRSVTEFSIKSDGSLINSKTINVGFVPRSLAATK
jgi:6-phosphogluconolactonase (cycloisomerase 2 family)